MPSHMLCLALLMGPGAEDPAQFINEHFAAHWKKAKLTPADRAVDGHFLRRASLDLIGRIPTVPELGAFTKEIPTPNRRQLIDRLLKHPEAARHWADVWTEALLGSHVDEPVGRAFHGWLEKHFARGGSHKELAHAILTVTGSTRDQPAGHLYVALRGQSIIGKERVALGQYDMAPLSNHLVRVFLGRRLQCVQCHDHPFNDDLNQAHFFGSLVFFRQVEFTSKRVGKEVIDEIADNPKLNATGLIPYERRNSVRLYVDPTFLDGTKMPKKYAGTRREFFAERLVAQPDFAHAFVQRMWHQLLGRGLSETSVADDQGTHNPVAHPKVLERLADVFVKSGHDPKAVLRAICLSDVYALNSVANKTNASPEKAVGFARQQVRPLSREQLVESVLTALKVSEKEHARLRDAWQRELQTPRLEPNSECEFVSEEQIRTQQLIRQALWLMNGPSINELLRHKDGTLHAVFRVHKRQAAGAIRDLFLHTLSRPPTNQELERLTKPPAYRLQTGNPDTDAFWLSYYEDLLWALVNSNEFGHNY